MKLPALLAEIALAFLLWRIVGAAYGWTPAQLGGLGVLGRTRR